MGVLDTFRGMRRRDRVAARSAGVLRARVVNGRPRDGLLELGEDPQIHFALKRYIGATSVLAQVEVEIAESSVEPCPRLYLDYGAGFRPESSVALARDGATWRGFVPVPHMLVAARLDLFEEPGTARLASLVARRATALQFADAVLRKGHEVAEAVAGRRAREAVRFLREAVPSLGRNGELGDQAALATLAACGLNAVVPEEVVADASYLRWIERHETLGPADVAWMRARMGTWASPPLLSVLMPVYDPPLELLEEAVRSLQAQVYPHWELCIADDASRDPEVRARIERLSADDPRIRYVFRAANGHISEATNSAAGLASGEFVVLMDNDDLLPPHALWTVAHYAQANPGATMLFSDEDKLSVDGPRCQPYHKGGFDRFLMYGHNMFSHLGVYRRSLFEKVGGFRVGYEGSQDYDLTLRCLDEAGEEGIVHIPHVLYHWRQIPGSTSMGAGQKGYAFRAAKRALNDHFRRNGYPLESVDADVPGIAAVRALSTDAPATVSVVIPTRDGLGHLRRCVDSLLAFPDPLMEVVVVDNGSVEADTLEYLDGLKRDPRRFRVVRVDEPFNFSMLVNRGVAEARGAIVCLLNDDTEMLVPGAFERVRAWLSIPDVGVVGARLLYPDGTLQHFGVHVGVGDHGVAEHAYLGMPDALHANFSKSRLVQQFAAVTGACLFMRKADYVTLGGCDEGFPVAYNDIDLCMRVRDRGLKVICDPGIRLVHHESRSRGRDVTPARKARLLEEGRRFLRRWDTCGEGLADPFYSPNFEREHSVYLLGTTAPAPLPWRSGEDAVWVPLPQQGRPALRLVS